MNFNFEHGPDDFAVETENLGRMFGKFEAVRDVSLRVPRGTVFGLLGVNGAGKSTVIKMIVGHLRPTTGRIIVLGRTLEEDLVEIRRRVAYVSENRYLYEWMTVAESISFTRAFHTNWDDRKAAQLLTRFSLPPEKKIRQLPPATRPRARPPPARPPAARASRHQPPPTSPPPASRLPASTPSSAATSSRTSSPRSA